MNARRERGTLAIVLHTHMPYVEGFGTWPFGEEWLWEAMAGCYLPLLDLLDGGAPLTLSLTPVLCDQLAAPRVAERFTTFVRDVRSTTHEQDATGMRSAGHDDLALELERSWGDYQAALASFERHGRDMLGALCRHAQWTSSATHAILPLLASEDALRTQIQTGVSAHRARAEQPWRGGFWLPECAHSGWLDPALHDARVGATCVELTIRFGLGAREHLQPLRAESGVVLVPIDRATISLVWSDGGYPANGSYRDYHHHTVHHHNPWSNDGGAYRHERAEQLAREHAADFVARTAARLDRDGSSLPGGGLLVCALDTELLGHWWYEGVAWLTAVVEECSRQGVELMRLDDALELHEPRELGGIDSWAPSSWGSNGDLSTWSGPLVADMAFATRASEIDVLAAGADAGSAAVRELLALQASDWPFLVSRGMAVPYAHERFEGHRLRLERALSGAPDEGALRNIAEHAHGHTLLAA